MIDVFNKAAPEAFKDYKKGVFKENGIDVIKMEESDIQFVDEIKDGNTYLLGESLEYDANSHFEVDYIKITAHGCVTMSECYATLGHEFSHMTVDNINMERGYGPEAPFNTPQAQKIQMIINSKRFQEAHAEVKGLWYAEYKGY